MVARNEALFAYSMNFTFLSFLQYLEMRFNKSVRMACTITYIVHTVIHFTDKWQTWH